MDNSSSSKDNAAPPVGRCECSDHCKVVEHILDPQKGIRVAVRCTACGCVYSSK